MEATNCQNCGRVIGKLETPYVFEDHVVCGDCLPKLKPNVIPYGAPAPAEKPRPPGNVVLGTIDAVGMGIQLFALVVGILIILAAVGIVLYHLAAR